jgi:hypothetical protein
VILTVTAVAAGSMTIAAAGPAASAHAAAAIAKDRQSDLVDGARGRPRSCSGTVSASCRLDAGKYVGCSKSHSYSKLPAGKHTFTVRVKHGSTTRSAIYHWTVDTSAPTGPLVAGGAAAWSAFVSDLSGYQYRTSPNGTTWSSATAGSAAVVLAQGTTYVQFRSLDKAGNASAWTPAAPDATDTVMLDRTAPSLPTVTGAPVGCVAGPVTLTASGSTDAWSGFNHYESQTNAGSIVSGASVIVSAHGSSTVKFRSVDALGTASAWVSTTVCLT